MGLGVLEPNTTAHVPGTVLLNEQAAHSESTTHDLKHAGGKNAHLILAPQPSEDPNDPLNWSFGQKHWILAVLCFGSIVNAVVSGPLLSAGTVQISMELNTTLRRVALLSGYLLLVTGATGPFVSAIARKWGKRPVFLFAGLMSLIGCIAGQCAKEYNQLLASRVVAGFAVAAYESIIVAAIGDLFFVHERGSRVALIMFILTTISNLINIISGTITAHLGWHYNFHILLPFEVVSFILTFFFVPETTYRRSTLYNIDTTGSEENLEKLAHVEVIAKHHEHASNDPSQLERAVSTASTPPLKKTYWQSLSVYNGVFVQDSVFKMFIACPVILFNIGALYSIIVSGLIVAWFVSISVLSSVMFAYPPYSFTAAGVGYVSTGPLIGGFIGCVLVAVLSDRSVQWMVKMNSGVYEPEFRLVTMVYTLPSILGGLIGFGYAVKNGESIYLVAFLWGLYMSGLAVLAASTGNYALDAFRQHSTEIFIMNMFFKNFFYYGLTNYIIDWYLTKGATNVYNIEGGVSAALILTTIPMYIWGKKYRHFWAYHNLIKTLHLETDKTGTEES